MTKKEATKVGCSTCGTDKGVVKTKRFVFIFGGFMFFLAIYGAIKLFKDIVSLF